MYSTVHTIILDNVLFLPYQLVFGGKGREALSSVVAGIDQSDISTTWSDQELLLMPSSNEASEEEVTLCCQKTREELKVASTDFIIGYATFGPEEIFEPYSFEWIRVVCLFHHD